MVQQEIEQEYEHTEIRTETETVTYCDGCGMEADDYVELTNVSLECIEKIIMAVHRTDKFRPSEMAPEPTIHPPYNAEEAVEKIQDEIEIFHFCETCQRGIREHQSIPAGLVEDDAPEEDPTDDGTPRWKQFVRMVCMFVGPPLLLTGAVYPALGIIGFVMTLYVVGAWLLEREPDMPDYAQHRY